MNLDKIKSLDRDDILNLLGLETQHKPVDYLLPGLALFSVGLAVGAGVGLLLAPRPGRELRKDIAERISEVPENLSKLPQRASDAAHRASEQISERLEDHKANT